MVPHENVFSDLQVFSNLSGLFNKHVKISLYKYEAREEMKARFIAFWN